MQSPTGPPRVNKSDDNSKNLETQLRGLESYGIRMEHIFTGEASVRSMDRTCWRDLMSRVQPELRGGSRHPGGPDPAGHCHSGPDRHPWEQRRRQFLPPGHVGSGRLPGGVGQRAHLHGTGASPGRRQADRSASSTDAGTGGPAPAHGRGRGWSAADPHGLKVLP